MFGEIDCREGLRVAVEKDRYVDLEGAVTAGVQTYVAALVRVQRQYGFAVYVHPIVPVMDATRDTVKLYNRFLKLAVDTEPLLTWLDFFAGFLTADGLALKPEYELDGTHLAPAYLPLMQQALQQAMM
jgi:hypothetical protein